MTNRHPATPPESAYPQHLWPDYAQAKNQPPAATQGTGPAGWPGGYSEQSATGHAFPGEAIGNARRGSGVFGVTAFVLGVLAVVAPLLPMDMTGFRQYVAFPFAVPGITLAAVGLAAHRHARPAAAAGLILSTLALGIATFMTVTFH
jgi:hypothetical protein